MKSLSFFKERSELRVGYTPSFGSEQICARLGIEFDENDNLVKHPKNSLPDYLKSMRPLTAQGLTVKIKHVFRFDQTDLVDKETSADTLTFTLGILSEDESHYVISGRILEIPQEVHVSIDAKIDIDFFATGYDKRTSVLKSISKMLDDDECQILIGTQDEDSIPLEEYESLLREFPTTTLLKHYGEKVIESHLQDYLSFKKSYSSAFYNASKRRPRKTRASTTRSLDTLDNLRLDALKEARAMLMHMLNEGERIPEQDWQEELLGILPLLFPQYVAVLSKVKISDVLTGKDREIDYLLIDASGNADVLELKRAFEKRHLLMARTYRDNYIPARELRGGVFQIEKYIHLLQNWGRAGEKALTERYQRKLPDGVKVRFLNPRGLLIMGHCELNDAERRDFDLIRRQHSRVTDIVTYDDLLDRLNRIIQSIASESMRLG